MATQGLTLSLVNAEQSSEEHANQNVAEMSPERSGRMVTVATFTKPEEAHLFSMNLESAGIESFIQDENFVQIDMLLSNAIGGVRVQVAEEDVPATREFLTSVNRANAATTAPPIICPACGSSKTTPQRPGFSIIAIVTLGFYLGKTKMICEDCANHFQ